MPFNEATHKANLQLLQDSEGFSPEITVGLASFAKKHVAGINDDVVVADTPVGEASAAKPAGRRPSGSTARRPSVSRYAGGEG